MQIQTRSQGRKRKKFPVMLLPGSGFMTVLDRMSARPIAPVRTSLPHFRANRGSTHPQTETGAKTR